MDNPSNGGKEAQGSSWTATAESDGEFHLKEFPKEFNKNFFEASDWRFLIILLISFLSHFAVIYYLEVHYQGASDEDFIIKIQNHYASRFLSESYREEESGPASEGYQNLLRSAAEWAQTLADETFDPAKIDAPLPLVEPVPDRPRKTSFEERNFARESVADFRRRSRAVLRDQVKNIGLLGVLTSGSGLVQVDAVEDILNYADSSSLAIRDKIEHVKSLRVPRPGVDFFGQGLGGDENVYVRTRDARSTRVLASGTEAADFVENLATARRQTVERKQHFEKVDARAAVFAGLSQPVKPMYETRSIERIRDVVMGHNPAIQDCYRRELKDNPNLKGKVTVRFTIDAEGNVTYAEIVRSTMKLPRMEACILKRIRRWNDFPRVSPEQGSVSIKHTYLFGY